MANSARRIQTSDFILAIIFVVPLLFFPLSADVFNFPKLWIFLILVFGVTVHFLLGGNQEFLSRVMANKGLTLYILTFATVLTWLSFSTESTSPRILFGYPGRSNGLLFYIGILIFFWVASIFRSPSNFPRLVKRALLALYAVFAIYSSIQLFELDPIEWKNPYNPVIGTLGNPNFSGAFLGVAAVTVLHLATYSHKQEKVRYVVFGLVLAALSFSTESLQGVGIFATGVLLILLKIVFDRSSLMVATATIILSASIGSLVFLGFLGLGPLGDRLFQYTLQLRLEYWRIGLEIAKEYPLTGIGPDSYIEGFKMFRSEAFVEKYSDQVISDSAHNVLINFMANHGIIAFALLFILTAIVSKRALLTLFSREKSSQELEILSLIWLLLLIQSLFSLEQIGISVLQWSCGGLMFNKSIKGPNKSEAIGNQQNRVQIAKGFTHGLRSEITVLSMLAAIVLTRGFIEQEIEIKRVAEKIVDRQTPETEIQDQISKFNHYTLEESKRLTVLNFYLLRAERLNEAEIFQEALLKADPDDLFAREQLARLVSYRGDLAREITLRREIEQLDPHNYTNLLSLAEVLTMSENFVEAKSYAQRVIEITSNRDIEKRAQEILDK